MISGLRSTLVIGLEKQQQHNNSTSRLQRTTNVTCTGMTLLEHKTERNRRQRPKTTGLKLVVIGVESRNFGLLKNTHVLVTHKCDIRKNDEP